jgi:hypothetical protein
VSDTRLYANHAFAERLLQKNEGSGDELVSQICYAKIILLMFTVYNNGRIGVYEILHALDAFANH